MDSIRKNTSIVWNYFTDIDKTKASCNFCKKLFSHKTSISNLKKHLLKQHPTIKIMPPKRRRSSQPQYQLKIEEINTNDPSEDTSNQPFQIEFVEVPEESPTNQSEDLTDFKRKKTSYLWNYFTIIDKEKARCNFCRKLFSHKTSITNLKSHLTKKHRSLKTITSTQRQFIQPQYAQKKEEIDVNGPGEEFLLICSTPDELVEPPKKPSTTSLTNNQPNERKSDTLLAPSKLNAAQKKAIDDQLLKMITMDFQPLPIVEDEGFRRLCQLLNPHYQIPSRKFLSNTLLSEKYLEIVNKAREVIKHAKTVTLTTDCWVSCSNDSFIALTAHFINKDFEIESILLDVSSFNENVASTSLASEFKRIVAEWGIETRNILLAITDNAANIKQAISENLQWRHWGCLVHTINLIVQDALKNLDPLTQKVREVVSFFKRNTVAKDELKKQQQKYQACPKKLILSDSTRWNSVFYMFQSFVELKRAISGCLLELERDDILLLKETEFDTLQEVIKILAPLEMAFKIMSGEQYVTLSSVIIVTNCLKNMYQELEMQQFSDLANSVIVQVISGLNSHFKDLESNTTLIVSTYLDPRYKNIGFSNDTVAEAAKTEVISLLTNLIEQNNPNCGEKFKTTLVQSDPASLLFQFFDKKVLTLEPTCSNRNTAINELQRYLEEPLLPRDQNPLSWWKTNGYYFPNLSILVKDTFGTVATSVPYEWIFSKRGQLLSDRRSRLSLQKVRKIMFIYQNERC